MQAFHAQIKRLSPDQLLCSSKNARGKAKLAKVSPSGVELMSADLRLLFAWICVRLDQSPSRSLMDLSRELQVSRMAIQKVVASMTNRKFSKFRDDILMAKLTRLLIARPLSSIQELSAGLGYRSVGSFAWQVKRASGASPAQLRIRIATELAAQNGAGQIHTSGEVACLHG